MGALHPTTGDPLMNKFFANLDMRYVKVCLYASVTVLLTLAACMVLHFASPVFAKFWDLICAVAEPIVYGAALSYILNPLVKYISRLLQRRERYADDGLRRRSLAVVISIVLVMLFIMSILLVLLLMITHSLSSLRWSEVQALLGTAGGDLMAYLSSAEQTLEEWGIISPESSFNLLSAFNGAKHFATTAVFAVIFAVYFLIDGPRVAAYLKRIGRAVLGTHNIDPSRFIEDADHVFSGYFKGQGIDAMLVGVLSGIALTAVGVPYGPLIGLLAGLGNLIPYVGGPVGFGMIAVMCLAEGAWVKMLVGFVVMGVIMFVDANIINPKLLSDNVEVHPILVLAALIAGGAVGGIAGMLVAVPMAAFLKIQLDRWLAKQEAKVRSKTEELA